MVAQSPITCPVIVGLTMILGSLHFMSVPARGISFIPHLRKQIGFKSLLSTEGIPEAIAPSSRLSDHALTERPLTKNQPVVENQPVDELSDEELNDRLPYQTVMNMTGTLEAGDSIAYQDGSLYDEYELNGQEGQRIWIRLESPEFDPYLILIDPQGNILAENDDIAPDDYTAFLDLVLPSDGVYRVVANGFDRHSRGRYWLTVILPPLEASSDSQGQDRI